MNIDPRLKAFQRKTM